MGAITTAFADAFRDYVTAGVPASGAHEPEKVDIRAIGPLIESAIGTASLGSVDVTKDTRANLNADLAWAADSIGLVYADATDANNDLYIKVGGSGSGSWTLTTILHDTVAALFAAPLALAEEWAENPEDDEITDNPGKYSALHWAAKAEGFAGEVTAAAGDLLPTNQLPSNVEALYPCDEGAGSTIRDIVGGHTATLTVITGSGTISWNPDGTLQLTNAGFKLPSMSHRAIILIGQQAETDGTNTYWCCSSSNEPFGRCIALVSEVPELRLLDGWGITEPRRNTNGSGFVAMEGGGWQMPSATFPATITGTPAIGARFINGTSQNPNLKLAGIVVCNTAPTDTELRQILNFMRPRARARGIYLTPEDCPQRAVLMVADGESTDAGRYIGTFVGSTSGTTFTVTSAPQGEVTLGAEIYHASIPAGTTITAFGTGTGGTGTYTLSANVGTIGSTTFNTIGLSATEQNAFAEILFTNAFANTNMTLLGKRMERMSHRPIYANSAALLNSTVLQSGWERGLRNALIERPHFGRRIDFLKIAQGSTFLLQAGDGTTTTSTDYPKASFDATIAVNTMTVTTLTSGVIMAGDSVVTPGGTRTITAYGTGAGGTGTYTINGASQTVASPTAMTSHYTVVNGASRHPNVKLPVGLISSLQERNLIKAEQHARLAGIGYTTVIFCTGDGLNDAAQGDEVITDAAMYEALLELKYDWYTTVTGIANPTWILTKPHLPYGSVSPTGDLGGADTDYPNNAIGTSRLNALNFVRTACDNMEIAHPGLVRVQDGTDFDVNNGLDYVHPSLAGNDAMGKAYDAIARAKAYFVASITGDVMTVTSVQQGRIAEYAELSPFTNVTDLPPGVFVLPYGTSSTTGVGLTGTYKLSVSLAAAVAAGPLSTLQLYRKPVVAAA